jgi:hypothetical protein
MGMSESWSTSLVELSLLSLSQRVPSILVATLAMAVLSSDVEFLRFLLPFKSAMVEVESLADRFDGEVDLVFKVELMAASLSALRFFT